MAHPLSLARHIGCDGSGLEPIASPHETLIDDASGELAAPQDESGCDAVDYDIALIDAEVEQRFAAIVIANENCRQLAPGTEPETCMHSVIGRSHGLDGSAAAEPIVDVAATSC